MHNLLSIFKSALMKTIIMMLAASIMANVSMPYMTVASVNTANSSTQEAQPFIDGLGKGEPESY